MTDQRGRLLMAALSLTTAGWVVTALTAGFFSTSAVRAQQSQPPPIIIRDIQVEGNRCVPDAVILGRIKSAVGSLFNPSLLAEDIRSIFSLGFFDDVRLRVQDVAGGVRIVFAVLERPCPSYVPERRPTQYDGRGWRATFYTTGMEHSQTLIAGGLVGMLLPAGSTAVRTPRSG